MAKRSSSSHRPSDDFFLDEEADWDEVTTESEAVGHEAEEGASHHGRQGQRTLGNDIGNLEHRIKSSWAGLSTGGKRAVVAAAAALIVVIVVVVVLAARGGDDAAPVEATAAEEAAVLPANETGTGDAAAGSEPEATGGGTATGGATSAGVSEQVTVRLGDQGENVRELQLALNDFGYNAGETDGVFGQTTKNAVTAFQTDASLNADGVVGPQTAKAINTALSELP